MYLFEKRPLSIILCILLGGFSLFVLFPIFLRWILLAAALLFLLVLIFLRKKAGRFPIVAAITLLISFGLSFCYFELYFPIQNRVVGQKEIKGTITSITYQERFGAEFTIQTDKIDGIPFSASKLLVTIESEEFLDSFSVDDEVIILGEIGKLSSATIGFDEKQYYETRGVQGAIKNIESISFIANSRFSIREWMISIQDRVSNYIRNSADTKTSGLLNALITGEKSALPGQLRLDFKRIGLSHVLAISGMHLAILTTALHKLLSLLRIDKKWRCAIAMLFVIGYMVLTGFPVSILRAGSMVLIANLLFLLGKTRDSLTNLMISVTAICVVSPYAVYDISLLLSFLATVGVLAAIQFLAKIPYHIPKWKKTLIAVFSSLLSSFFAIALTLPFSVFTFERLSYIAPLTSLIFSLLVEIFMYIGSIFLLLGAPGFFLPFVEKLADWISDLAAYFAELPNVYSVANGNLLRTVSIVFYILLLTFLFFKIRHKNIALSVLAICFCSIFIIANANTNKKLEQNRILYHSDTIKNDAIIAIQNKSVLVANMTDNTSFGRSYLLHSIDGEDILSIDHFWIPQYTANLPDALYDLLSSIPIQNIYLPEPINKNEFKILSSVSEVLKGFRCGCSYFSESNFVKMEEMLLYQAYRPPMEDGCRVIFSLKHDGAYYTYIAHGAIEEENTDLANYLMSESHTVIFGCRGRSYSEIYYLEEISPGTKAIIIQTDDIEISEDAYLTHKDQTKFYYKPSEVVLTKEG